VLWDVIHDRACFVVIPIGRNRFNGYVFPAQYK
jgi:hypothetical protein